LTSVTEPTNSNCTTLSANLKGRQLPRFRPSFRPHLLGTWRIRERAGNGL